MKGGRNVACVSALREMEAGGRILFRGVEVGVKSQPGCRRRLQSRQAISDRSGAGAFRQPTTGRCRMSIGGSAGNYLPTPTDPAPEATRTDHERRGAS